MGNVESKKNTKKEETPEQVVTKIGLELAFIYIEEQDLKQDLARSSEELKKVGEEMHACIDRGEAATNEIMCFESVSETHNLLLERLDLIKQNRKILLEVLSTMQASCTDADVVCGRAMWKAVNAACSLNA